MFIDYQTVHEENGFWFWRARESFGRTVGNVHGYKTRPAAIRAMNAFIKNADNTFVTMKREEER